MTLNSRRVYLFAILLAVAVIFLVPRAAWRTAGNFSKRSYDQIANTLVSVNSARSYAKRFEIPINRQPFTPYDLEPAFENLQFVDPVAAMPIPDRPGELAVVQRNGLIYAVSKKKDNWNRQVYLDLRSRVHSTPNLAEEGLLGVAFHPDFAADGAARRQWLFVSYTGLVFDKPTHRVTRFEAPRHSSTIDDRTETVLIDQVYTAPRHKGGCLAFGPDRFLYLSFGDDGDAVKNAQHIDGGFFSGILRIDVDQRGGEISHEIRRAPRDGHSQNYYIPSDNPFVGLPNALEEYFAIGFRNPWRFSFDPATGKVLVGDVGDKLREEVHLVGRGDNGGWPLREGTYDKSAANTQVTIGTEVAPRFEYSRIGFHLAIIGGYIYRGKDLPQLKGKYIYADQSGRIYSVDLSSKEPTTPSPIQPTLVASLEEIGVGISSLGVDERGELLFCAIGELGSESGQIYRLRVNANQKLNQPPERLSETGLFEDLKSLTPVKGFLPYEVASPLWSDGALKRRWISLPEGQKIQGKLRDRWQFPAGTVFIKHFEFPSSKHVGGVRRIGTRFLIVDDEGRSRGATYRWNEEQTDAFRVDTAVDAELEIDGDNGEKRTVTWSHPGRFDCQRCHNEAAGFVLGFNYKQLNRLVVDPERQIETGQLVRLRNLGLLENNFDDNAPGELPRLVAIDDKSVDIEHRLRSYLEVNCAPCHRPGLHYAGFDTRFATPLHMTNLINGEAFHARVGDDRNRLIVPGDHAKSLLLDRMQSPTADWRMPPLGRNKIDDRAVALLKEWITTLPHPVTATAAVKGDAVK